jgi:hypothetical protein
MFMNKNINLRRALAWPVAVFIMLIFIFSAFAEGGDGSGGGKDIPFQFVSSSIPNGSEDVETDTDIVLLFNKNVVNITVRENNMKCFTLKDSGGKEIPVEIIMGDDQVEPTQEVKRTVTVKPKSDLSSGETYLLKISKDLQAKNGSYLGKDTYISFSTAAGTSSRPADTTSTSAARVTTVKSPAASKQIVITKATTSAKANTAETTAAETSQTAANTTAVSSVTVFTTSAGRVTRSTRAASSSKQDKTGNTETSSEKKTESAKEETAQRTSQAETTLVPSTVTLTQPESVTASVISPEISYPEEDTGYTEYETYEESETESEDSFAGDSQTDPAAPEKLTQNKPADETGNKTPLIIGAVIFALVLTAAFAAAIIKTKNKKS